MAFSGVPLVVDLDGTLSKVDTLHEAFLNAFTTSPRRTLLAIPVAFQDKGLFKARIADIAGPDVDLLPLRPEVLKILQEAKADGRQLVLATGAHANIANALARRLGLFDEVHCTTDGHPNLVGKQKANALVGRFGSGTFDYIGDSKADLPVWKSAKTAYFVGSSSKHASLSKKLGTPLEWIESTRSGSKPWKILRPHQWVKNILLFLPLLASHQIQNTNLLAVTILAVLAFCLAASGVYIINDMHDRESDRRNPSKSRRPIASGTLPVTKALALFGLVAIGLISILSVLPKAASFAIGIYLLVNILYTASLKRRLLVDVFLLAFMYVWRVVAGGLVTGILLSPWLLGFAGYLFLSLAFAKRYAEIIQLESRGETMAAGRAWQLRDAIPLAAAGIGCGIGGTIVLALYTTGSSFSRLYKNAEVTTLLAPLFLYWIMRIWLKACRKELDEDPVLFTAKDRISYLVGILSFAILMVASY